MSFRTRNEEKSFAVCLAKMQSSLCNAYNISRYHSK